MDAFQQTSRLVKTKWVFRARFAFRSPRRMWGLLAVLSRLSQVCVYVVMLAGVSGMGNIEIS